MLIDYENVQPSALSALTKEFFKVYVFVGANQSKVNFDTVEAVQRLGSNGIHDIPIVKVTNASSLSERVSAVVTNLKQRGNSRPRTPKILSSTVNSLFQKSLSESELAGLLKALEQQGHIVVSGNKVTYSLS
ncbi:MAG TPA: PIN domain-containing protein [Pyrinomonadaceae bacterium]